MYSASFALVLLKHPFTLCVCVRGSSCRSAHVWRSEDEVQETTFIVHPVLRQSLSVPPGDFPVPACILPQDEENVAFKHKGILLSLQKEGELLSVAKHGTRSLKASCL